MFVVDYVIICALTEEANEVKARFEIEKESDIGGYQCSFAYYNELRLVIVDLDCMGNLSSQHAASYFIKEFNPHFIILVGICGGLINPDLKLGDIIVTNKVIYYEPSKVSKGVNFPRYEKYFIDDNENITPIFSYAKEISDGGWDAKSKIRMDYPGDNEKRYRPKVHHGVIMSGEKVIADTEYAAELRNMHEDSISIEMEAAGIAFACQNTNVDFLVIKGVSDFADDRKCDGPSRDFARNSAAAYLEHFLEKGGAPLKNRIAPLGVLSDLFRLNENEPLVLVLPSYRNTRHSNEAAQRYVNYPFNEYETAYDDVYCAFRLLSSLEKICGSNNVKLVFDQSNELNLEHSMNLILIGSSVSNIKTRNLLDDGRSYFRFGTEEKDHDILDYEGKVAFKAEEKDRPNGEKEYVADYVLVSVFRRGNQSSIVLAGCRAFSQLFIGDFFAEGFFVEDLFRIVPKGDFQCVIKIQVSGRDYWLDNVEKVVSRKSVSDIWSEENVEKLNRLIRAQPDIIPKI